MKIKTQLIISVVIFVIALLIIGVSILVTNQQVDRLNHQQDIVRNIQLGSSELADLSNDYLAYHGNLQLDRWNTKYGYFSDDISNLRVDTPEQQVLVNNIKGNQARLKNVFDNVVLTVEKGNLTYGDNIDPSFVHVSWDRIAVQTRGITFDASRLSQKLADEVNQVKQTNNLLIFTLIGAFAIFLLVDYLLIFGRTIKSMANLQAGTKVIGSGNLDYSIKAKKGDEVAELADAFNQMTARLKTVTASKADLENEIAERQQIEMALQSKREELEINAEELEVLNEELRTNNDELSRVNQSLQESEAALRNSERLYRAIGESIDYGVWVRAPDGQNIYASESFLKLVGMTQEQCSEFGWGNVLHPDDAERTIAAWKECVRREGNWDIELRHLGVDGKYHPILARGVPVRDDEGKIIYWAGINLDISNLKEKEEELKDAKLQAELYLDLMGHDISNMHQIILGQLQLAREIIDTDGRLEGDDTELIDTSIRNLMRSANLIDNVKKLQRLRAGEYSKEPVDLGKVLSDAVATYSSVPDKKVYISYIPEKGNTTWVNPLIKEVFNNLIDNAVKHSGDPVRIGIGVSQVMRNGSRYHRVAIEDNGPGIPDEKKTEVFHRLKRGQTKARGTGLGLYLVKMLVESFDGIVELEDKVKGDYTQGSRFIVYLPVVEGENYGK